MKSLEVCVLFRELILLCVLSFNGTAAYVMQAPTSLPTSPETIERRLADLEDKVRRPKKDLWDKVGTISSLTSGVLVAFFGIVFTTVFTKRQKEVESRRNNIQTIEKFLPYLSSDNEDLRRIAFAAISALGDEVIALKIAKNLSGSLRISTLLELAAQDGPTARDAEVELLRFYGEVLARVVVVDAKLSTGEITQVATGFILDGEGLVGTVFTTSYPSMSDIEVDYGENSYPTRFLHKLPKNAISSSHEVLVVKGLSTPILQEFEVEPEDPKQGDLVVVVTRSRKMFLPQPELVVARVTASYTTGAHFRPNLPRTASGSPVFTQTGKLLGLLYMTGDRGSGGIVKFQNFVDSAARRNNASYVSRADS